MVSDKQITFCILSYNRPDYLKRCIDSCLLYASDSKIIILDNSYDQSLIRNLQKKYPDFIEWHFSDETLGYAKNFLRSFALCKSQYLVALHDDDRITKEFCQTQLSILNANNKASAISCNGYFIDSSNTRIRPLMPYKKIFNKIKVFSSKDDYIAHKYSIVGSCIPFSPMMFDLNKAMHLKHIIIDRAKEFGQAIDAILIIDLLSDSDVILNYEPLYECGDHAGQDSKVYDNFWESQFMLYLLRGSSISNKAKKIIISFYMTDIIINWAKSLFNKDMSVNIIISREIFSLKVIPNVMLAVFTRALIKLKLKRKGI